MYALRIFIVADFMSVSGWLSVYLEDIGHTVGYATSMRKALSSLAQDRFDVLVCDTRLPDGDGWELLRQIHLSQLIYAVAISDSNWKGEVARSEAAGFRCHLVKPFKTTEIDAALDEAVREIRI